MRISILSCCLFLCLLGGCRPKQDEAVVRVTGASTVYPIVVMAADALKHQYGIRIEAQAGGSTRGFNDNLEGRNDLGAMARELSAEEAAQVKKYPIARDGIGILVHTGNAVTQVTTEQLRQIYRKELVNWSALGGPDAEIVVANKAEGHATLESFLEHTGLTREELVVDVVAGDNAQMIRVVANTPNAIGYVSLSEVVQSIEMGMPIRLIPLDGIEPDEARVADGSYPMTRTLYLVSKNEPNPSSQRLIDYFSTDEGHELLKKGHYAPY